MNDETAKSLRQLVERHGIPNVLVCLSRIAEDYSEDINLKSDRDKWIAIRMAIRHCSVDCESIFLGVKKNELEVLADMKVIVARLTAATAAGDTDEAIDIFKRQIDDGGRRLVMKTLAHHLEGAVEGNLFYKAMHTALVFCIQQY